MIQTPLISTLPQAPSADGSATLLASTVGGEGGVQPSGEGKAAFSQAMAMAQLMGKAPASQGNPALQGPAEGAREGLAPAAKSLASDEPATESASSLKGADDEGELPPDDFLQQLQASLRQDVSLVVPPTSPAMAGEAAVPVDGNPLPPGAASPGMAEGVGMAEDVGMAEGVEAAEGSASLPQMAPERQHEGNRTKAIPGAAQGASAVPSGQGALPLGAEEPPWSMTLPWQTRAERPSSPWQARERSRVPRGGSPLSRVRSVPPCSPKWWPEKTPRLPLSPGLTHRKRHG
ncbi:hypothetical protein ACSZOH_02625 [Aeromonas caviae]